MNLIKLQENKVGCQGEYLITIQTMRCPMKPVFASEDMKMKGCKN